MAEAIGESRSSRQRFNEAAGVLSGVVQGAESAEVVELYKRVGALCS